MINNNILDLLVQHAKLTVEILSDTKINPEIIKQITEYKKACENFYIEVENFCKNDKLESRMETDDN